MQHNKTISNIPKTNKLSENPLYQPNQQPKALSKMDARPDNFQDETKLYKIAMALNQVQTCWKKLSFDFSACSSTFLIKNYNELHEYVDAHIVNIRQISKAPESKAFEGRLTHWNNKLVVVSDNLDELEKCQKSWMYLQGLLDGDMDSKLSEEIEEFEEVDSTWKTVISEFRMKGNVFDGCSQESLFLTLKETNQKCDTMFKKLDRMLQTIRQKFPRFYFLSNEDLLSILIKSKNPRSLQNSLNQVFESNFSLDFDEKDRIIALDASEERVQLVQPVPTKNRRIEEWIGQLQKTMKLSVKDAIKNALQDSQKDISELLHEHIGQAIVTASRITWTGDVERCLQNEEYSMTSLEEKMRKNWNSLMKLVKTNLPPQKMKILNNLIIKNTHDINILEKLKLSNVHSSNAFEWILQLRKYWDGDCHVKCMETNLVYDYEYQNNNDRLVITPLTDKCYITLMTALKLNLGGAPCGPAGTGKTQTVKDLSKEVGKLCVVHNCSDQLDYKIMAKMFKGVASSGSWICFDEFNRICVEVLSSVGEQLKELFRARQQKSQMVFFEGTHIKMNHDFGVFITMNPGYAGRTQLPDNLKSLFRPISMTVPDRQLIVEAMLHLEGFSDVKSLSKKFINVFKTSEEQLSKQRHYDFGLRAIKSVVRFVAKLRQAEPFMEDDELLLKTIRSIIVPKIVKNDLPIFNNILLTLFPGVQVPKRNNKKLVHALANAAKQENFQPTEQFIQKALELYDTIQLRHANMLIGPSGSGKTAIFKTVSKALSTISPDNKINLYTINPKQVTIDDLFGQFNKSKSEWKDGIFSKIMRRCGEDQSGQNHWIILDGPIDAVWVEQLNALMDDNKKLHLNNGETLSLQPNTKIFFEVEDVNNASPATVSRCGVVYIERSMIGTDVLFDSWYQTLPLVILKNEKVMEKLKELKDIFVEPILKELRKQLKEEVQTYNCNLCQSLMRILDSIFAQITDKKMDEDSSKKIENSVEAIYVYSVIWSLCCTTDLSGRKKLNSLVRNIIEQQLPWVEFPSKGTIYDYQYNIEQNKFVPWQQPNKAQIDPSLQYSDVVIPTAESNRTVYFLKMLVTNEKHALSCGPAGIGKSSNIRQLLASELGQGYQFINLPFTTQTKAKRIRQNVMSKLEKVRGRLFGPKHGKKCILFVDDMNMPKRSRWGTRSPCQLIRSCIDNKQWYDSNNDVFQMQGVTVLAAMETSRGLAPVTGRLVRHFNVMTDTEFGKETMTNIFTQLLTHFHQGFSPSVTNIHSQMVEAGISIYEQTRCKFTATNNTPHYDFHFRDIWKVFKGISSASSENTRWAKDALKLWYNQNMRVYHDRLSYDEDKTCFRNLLDGYFPEFGYEKEEIMSEDKIMFENFSSKGYKEVKDLSLLTEQIYKVQQISNESSSCINKTHEKQDLVLFDDAVEHITRISRAINQPRGNALVLGTRGLGRKSISRIAAYLTKIPLFEIKSSENYDFLAWRQDLKEALMKVGTQNKQLCFLVNDEQFCDEKVLEDINDVLNGQEFSEIYNQKEIDNIVESCKEECLRKGQAVNEMNAFTYYLNRIKSKLRVILIMNPKEEKFAERIRMFPSLTKCCTIDWISEWPEEALKKVARGKLSLPSFEENKNEVNCSKTVEAFKNIHKYMEKESLQYKNETGLDNCVNSASYLELIETYKRLIAEKNVEYEERNEFIEEKPKQKVEVRRKISQKIQSFEEDELLFEQKEIYLQKEEVQSEMSEVLTQLEHSVKEFRDLDKKSVTKMKALASPPAGVAKVMAGFIILFEEELKKKGCQISHYVKKDETKKYVNYWAMAKKYILNKDFLQMVKNFDKEHVSNKTLSKLKQNIFADPQMTVDNVKCKSQAASVMFGWLKSIYDYAMIKAHILDEGQMEVEFKLKEQIPLKADSVDEQDNFQKQKEILSAQLQEGRNGLILIKAQHINELKCYKNPHYLIKTLFGGFAILFQDYLRKTGVKAIFYPQKGQNKKQMNYEEMGIKYILNHKSFLQLLLQFDKNLQNISKKTLEKLETQLFNHPDLTIENLKKITCIAPPLFVWIKSIYNLGVFYEKCSSNQQRQAEKEQIKQSSRRASNEFLHFKSETKQNSFLPGDVIFSAGMITYGGIFDNERRQKLSADFKTIIEDIGIPLTNCITLRKFFNDQNTIRKWHRQANLPIDQHSIENAIIVQKTQRKALVIDPQNQASKFIQKFVENKERLKIINETGSNFSSETKANSAIINFTLTPTTIKEELLPEIMSISRDISREKIESIASRVSLLYFCIKDLSKIQPYYQFSYNWFKQKCVSILRKLDLTKTENNVLTEFTLTVKQIVEPCLFSKHRLAFAFLIAARTVYGECVLQREEFIIFLEGFSEEMTSPANPTSYIEDSMWPQIFKQLYGVSTLSSFQGIDEFFIKNSDKFKHIFESINPHKQKLPKWEKELNQFQKILLLNVLRPDKTIFAVKDWISQQMGHKFLSSSTCDISYVFNESTPKNPILLSLTNGSDPIPLILKFAEEKHMEHDLTKISMGQGKEALAEKVIKYAADNGGWVVIQDLHYCPGWMASLEKILDNIQKLEDVDENFRLWITSMPSHCFPKSVIQKSIKMAVEPTETVKQNLLKIYNNLKDEDLYDCKKASQYKKLLFALSNFHAAIMDRRRYGQNGWNLAYDWTKVDFESAKAQLKIILNTYEEIPFNQLSYMIGDIIYGGRVTDDKDNHLVHALIKNYINPEVLMEGYKFSKSGLYFSPELTHAKDYVKYIESLPEKAAPQALGMHSNMNILQGEKELEIFTSTLKKIKPEFNLNIEGQNCKELFKMVNFIEWRFPQQWDIEKVKQFYPVTYEQSLNQLLINELQLFNTLIQRVKQSISKVKKFLKNENSIDRQVSQICKQLLEKKVPEWWQFNGFMSIKSIYPWVLEVNNRANFFQSWVDSGIPKLFWMNAFFIPHSFLTAILQNHSRKYLIAAEKLTFNVTVMQGISQAEIEEGPEDGVFVHGLYMEGARWDSQNQEVASQFPRQTISQLPIVHLLPKEKEDTPARNSFNCPVYQVQERKGVSSRTGRTWNFVMYMELPSRESWEVWIKNRVAIFLSSKH